MVDAMRDPMAERGLRTITAAVKVFLAAERTALDRHGPVAAARGPDDRDGGVRRFDGGTGRRDDVHDAPPADVQGSSPASPIGPSRPQDAQ
jgi:hypothetical protein